MLIKFNFLCKDWYNMNYKKKNWARILYVFQNLSSIMQGFQECNLHIKCSDHLILLHLTILILSADQYTLSSPLTVHFSPISCYFLPVKYKYSPQYPVTKHSKCISQFHSDENCRQNYNFVYFIFMFPESKLQDRMLWNEW